MSCSKITKRCVGVHSCCHANLLYILENMARLFRMYKIPYWITFGTLLGAVRNQKFIPWDEDTDLGVMEEDFSRVLAIVPHIQDLGFCTHEPVVTYKEHDRGPWLRISETIDISNRESIPLSLSIFLSDINALHVDIFTFGHDNKKAWCWEVPTCQQPVQDFQKLSTVVFEGREYPCPSNPERSLKAYYGDTWQTPRVKFWQGSRVEDEILKQEMETLVWYD